MRLTCSAAMLLLLPSLSMAASNEPADRAALLERLAADVVEGARVLPADQIGRECAGHGDLSTTLAADFDGDGDLDYAAVLVVNASEQVTIWNGQGRRRADLWLVAFLADPAGGYTSKVLETLPTYLPSTSIGIRRQAPGDLRLWDSDEMVRLPHPGIARLACEKSETVFYWDGTTFRQAALSD